MNYIKLKRIYPEVKPVNVKKRVGKVILWGLIPIEPLVEVLILPASLLLNKLLKRESTSADWLEINPTEIKIGETETEEKIEFVMHGLTDIKLHFHDNLEFVGDDGLNEDQLENNTSRITFILDENQRVYFFECKKKVFIKVCKKLYENKVVFKEYHNTKRMFLGRQPKYSEIQKIKKEYNIEW